MSLNDQLLSLDTKVRYYTIDNFDRIPSEPGVYAWFYPLRIRGAKLEALINEVNFIFNFCRENPESLEAKVDFKMGWRDYSLESKLDEHFLEPSQKRLWDKILESTNNEHCPHDLEQVKKIVFISSIFMPPLYIGKTCDLFRRCSEHVMGGGDRNSFYNRFKKYVSLKDEIGCKTVGDLIFACISTKNFGLENKGYEDLFEDILMNLVKPVFSIR